MANHQCSALFNSVFLETANQTRANSGVSPTKFAVITMHTIAIIVSFDDDTVMTYPGGKGRCYQRLINLMPPHRVYIESHLGAGAVMKNKKYAEHSIGIDTDIRVIELWRPNNQNSRLKIINMDAVEYLAGRNYAGDELIYCDPPYVPSTRNQSRIYRHDYTIMDHTRLLDTLVNLPCMILISGYNNDLYNSRLVNWRKETFTAQSQSGKRQETVWMNYPAPQQLHDTSYLGYTYRDRQSLKRRKARWLKKFDAMNPPERHDLLRTLNNLYGTPEG